MYYLTYLQPPSRIEDPIDFFINRDPPRHYRTTGLPERVPNLARKCGVACVMEAGPELLILSHILQVLIH